MAVKYSKLGGCLGVTAKLGPLARTDLWAGVKGLLERLMTHLGLGSSLEDPWGDYWGVVVRLSSWEIVLFSWEAWGALCLEECLRPCLTDLAWLLNWPAWGELLPSPWEGWAVAWGVLLPLHWEEGEQWPGENCFLCQREGEQLPGRNCFLHPREGEQLPGENCFLPKEEGEQLPEENWWWHLTDCLLGLHYFLPREEGE